MTPIFFEDCLFVWDKNVSFSSSFQFKLNQVYTAINLRSSDCWSGIKFSSKRCQLDSNMTESSRSGRSIPSADRILIKMKNMIDNEQYYEAHQLYRTVNFRYLNWGKYRELQALLFDGSNFTTVSRSV